MHSLVINVGGYGLLVATGWHAVGFLFVGDIMLWPAVSPRGIVSVDVERVRTLTLVWTPCS